MNPHRPDCQNPSKLHALLTAAALAVVLVAGTTSCGSGSEAEATPPSSPESRSELARQLILIHTEARAHVQWA